MPDFNDDTYTRDEFEGDQRDAADELVVEWPHQAGDPYPVVIVTDEDDDTIAQRFIESGIMSLW